MATIVNSATIATMAATMTMGSLLLDDLLERFEGADCFRDVEVIMYSS